MKRVLYAVVLIFLFALATNAQRVSGVYDNVSMSDALRDISRQSEGKAINFMYDELEDFKVTTTIRNKPLAEAVLQLIGFYPMRMSIGEKGDIFVECTHKTDRHLTGCIVDENGQPIAYANIALLNPMDSTILSGGVSNEGGVFVIPYEQPQVLARVSYVGYKTVYRLFCSEQAGTIKMQPDNYTIKGVVVKGEKPQYKLTTDGITVDIQNSILKDIGTADEMLSMLPLVQGEDGRFTIFAKGTPEIYINNRKVQNVKDLKLLKSADIKSVDVITSPGAKYNAEVNAVIRIKTMRPQDDGVSVAAFSQVKRNNKWTTYDDATVKYRNGGLEVFGSMEFENGNHSEDNMIMTDIYSDDSHLNIVQVCPNSFWYTNLGGKIGASYDFDEDNSVGFSYSLDGSLYGGGIAETQQTITRNNVVEGTVDQWMYMGKYDTPQHEANIYYVGKAGKLGIDFNGSWIWKKTTRNLASIEHSAELDDRDIHTCNVNRNRMLAGKLVLSYPIWKGQLEIGSEATRSNSHGEYDNTEQILLPSNDEIKESNVAGFAEYHLPLGCWSIGGGLRYESVNSKYYSFGVYQEEPSRSYHDLFPNISVGWQRNKLGIQLNYNKRISRPSYYSLNSNVQYDNRYEYEGGNPLLRPAIRQNLDLSLVYSWLTFRTGYGHSRDMQLQFGDLYQNSTEVTMWAKCNFDKHESYYASLVLSPKFGIYTPTLTVDFSQQYFDVKQYGVAQSMSKPQWELGFRNWLTINETAKVMVYLYYSTSNDYGFSRDGHNFTMNVRVQKSFFNDSMTAVLFANDIFRTCRDRWTGYYPVMTMSKDAYVYTQYVGISLSYNLNATRSKYKGTGAGNEEKNRL